MADLINYLVNLFYSHQLIDQVIQNLSFTSMSIMCDFSIFQKNRKSKVIK